MSGITPRIKYLRGRFATCVSFGVGDVSSSRRKVEGRRVPNQKYVRFMTGSGKNEGYSSSWAPPVSQCAISDGRKHGKLQPALWIGFKSSQLVSQIPKQGGRLMSKKAGSGNSNYAVRSNITELYNRMQANRAVAATAQGTSEPEPQPESEPEPEKLIEGLSGETTTPDPTACSVEIQASSAAESTSSEKSTRSIKDLETFDISQLLQKLPSDMRDKLVQHADLHNLIEVVMDLGRRPEAQFAGHVDYLREEQVTTEDLQHVVSSVGRFGMDNRAGIEGTLHRISCVRNREGAILGLTLRVGKPIVGLADFLADIVADRKSVLFLGAPGVGKTSVIRDVARVLSTKLGRRVMIVDTSNEIAGDGVVPHPFVGRARRLHVPDIEFQYTVMVEAVQNHRPEVIVVDEIGRWEEAQACISIAQRGVQIIATAHGQTLENLMTNSPISSLVGGLQTVVVSDLTAREKSKESDHKKPARKTIQERRRPAAFQYIIEMRSRTEWIIHHTETSVDSFLRGESAEVQVRRKDPDSGEISKSTIMVSPEEPVAFSMKDELGLEDGPKGQKSHRKKLPAWEWFRSGVENVIRRRLEAEDIPSSQGKVNEMSNSVISDVQIGISHLLGTPPLHIKGDESLEEVVRESTILSGEVELWMRRMLAEGVSDVEMTEAEINSGSQILATKALSRVQEEVSRLRAEGILAKLNGVSKPRQSITAQAPKAVLEPMQGGSDPVTTGKSSVVGTAVKKSARPKASIPVHISSEEALKMSFLDMIKEKMPWQSEARIVTVQQQLCLIMEQYLSELSGKPDLAGTRPEPVVNIRDGATQKAYEAYKHVLSNVVVKSAGIATARVDREAARLLHITKCQLGALAKRNSILT